MSLPYSRIAASSRSVSRAPRPAGITPALFPAWRIASHTRSAAFGGANTSKPSSPVYPVREMVTRTPATSPVPNQ
jgi:hypothetical protein